MMARYRGWLVLALAEICLVGCVTPPAAAPRVGARTYGGFAPQYPAEYQASPRIGKVKVRCQVLPDLQVRNCTAEPVQGGDGFVRTTLEWLASPAASAPALHGPRTDIRVWTISFVPGNM